MPQGEMEINMALKTDLTRGSVHKHVLSFAMPLLFSNLFQLLYNVVDIYFVGKFSGTGSNGITAVTNCGIIIMVLVSAVMGMVNAATILIGQYWGARDVEGVKRVTNTANCFFFIVGIVITILGLLLSKPLLHLINIPQESMQDAMSYLSIIFCGVIFTIGYNLISAYQRGLGDSKTSMYFIIIATVVNIVLDYIFIKYFKMGVSGAALATIIAQGISFGLGVYYLKKQNHIIEFSFKKPKIDKKTLGQIVKLGLPSSIQQTLLSISFSVFMGLINGYGLSAAAAYGIGGKVDSFVVLPAQALGLSVSSVVSQNLGVKKYDRALKASKIGMIYSAIIGLFFTVIIYTYAPGIIGFFTNDAEVIEYGTKYLHILPIMYIPFGVMWTAGGLVQGSGNTMYAMLTSLFSQYIIRIPVAFILSNLMGIEGIYWAMILGPFIGLFANVGFIISKKWKKTELIKTLPLDEVN